MQNRYARYIGIAVLVIAGMSPTHAQSNTTEGCSELLNYTATALRSSTKISLCDSYKNKVILAVNTASQCGFTPQFKALETLHKRYQSQGLVVLGFPSNDFRQEYKNASDTAKVCYVNYGVTFQMFESSSVKGPNANAFFKGITAKTQEPGWNFTKYLIDRAGKKVQHFPSHIQPTDSALEAAIQRELFP